VIDKVIKVGSNFDWISPIAHAAQDKANGPAVRFNVPADCGWHAYDIRDVLTSKGVKVWGLNLYQDMFVFSVRKAQAEHAAYWLKRAGIPYSGGPDVQRGNGRRRGGIMGKLRNMFKGLGKKAKGATDKAKTVGTKVRKVGSIGAGVGLLGAAALGVMPWMLLPMPLIVAGAMYKSPKWGAIGGAGYGALWALPMLL